MGKNRIPLPIPAASDGLNPGLLNSCFQNDGFSKCHNFLCQGIKTTALEAATTPQLFQLCRKALQEGTFCTVPALEATLGCLGFLVRSTLRTLSVISSTWAWTLFRQMSDRGLQYWSIKTAPGTNKLHKKQDFSSFFACFCLLYSPGMQRAVAAEQQSSVCEPAVISWIHKMHRVSWHEKLPAELCTALSTLWKASVPWAGVLLGQAWPALQPLAPPQHTEIFIQSLKQSQLHSNCLSSDCSLSHPPYHPCSSFPYLLHSSFSSTPALHLPNTTQNRLSCSFCPSPSRKIFSFHRASSFQSLELAGRILHGPYLFQPPTPWLCQCVHDWSVNQGIQ